MKRSLVFIAILWVVATLAVSGQSRFSVVLVVDSERGVKPGAYGDALVDQRNSGVFSRKPGLRQEIEVLDFSRPSHLSHLKAWGLSRQGAPYLAIGELNSTGGVTRLIWRSKVGSPQQAVAILGQQLKVAIRPLPIPEYVNPKDGYVLVNVPAGEFSMGASLRDKDAEPDEKPGRTVRLGAYQMGKFEVTNAQYARFVGSTGYDAGSQWLTCAQRWGERAPVVCVSFDDAQAYCNWAGLRLPREAEWERAARGTDGRIYPWGGAWDASRAVVDTTGAQEVGSKSAGISPAGCLDMAGNVWEWVDDWHDPEKKLRVVRGGGWDSAAGLLRCSARGVVPPAEPNFLPRADRNQDLGFRCAR